MILDQRLQAILTKEREKPMKKTTGILRHGDLNIYPANMAGKLGVDGPPSDRSSYELRRDHVLAGSHGGSHVLVGDALVSSVGERVTYLKTDRDTVIRHADRHLDGEVPAGGYIVIRMRDADGLVED